MRCLPIPSAMLRVHAYNGCQPMPLNWPQGFLEVCLNLKAIFLVHCNVPDLFL